MKKKSIQQKPAIGSIPVQKKIREQGFLMKNKELLLLAVVIIITMVIYFPTLHHKFTNWDDNEYIMGNVYIKALTSANLAHIFTKPVAANYHPLTMLSLALNYRFAGIEPFSYFLVNIILHLFNTLLTFYFSFLILGRNKPLALFVAAIFAIHPMHVESVAWISERKDVLYAFFFLSGLISWVYFIRKRTWLLYLLAFVLFILAGLSKPTSVVFPLILLLLDYLYKRKFDLLLLVEKIPFFLIALGIGMATIYAQVDSAVADIHNNNVFAQFLYASYGFFIYIFKLIIPAGLSTLHPFPGIVKIPDLPWVYFITPAVNLAIVGLVLYSLKFTRMLLFCLIFYFLNIALTLQFVQVGSAIIAERYTYISYIGILIGLAWLINHIAERNKIPMTYFYLFMVLFFGVNTILSSQRVSVWKNSETLWSDVIAKYPESYTSYNSRGMYYLDEEMLDKALADFTKSVEIYPTYTVAISNRGNVFRKQNLPRLSVAEYNKALAIDPVFIESLFGRASAYLTLGLLDSALIDFNKALKINPVWSAAFGNRGCVFFRSGQTERAIEDFNSAISIDKNNAEFYLNRGVAFSTLKKWDLAVNDYTFVLKSRSDYPDLYVWRAVAYRNTGKFQLAIDDFSTGIRLDPRNSSFYVNRALAYKQAGMNQKAADDIKMAQQLGAKVTEQSVFSNLK
jgi:tetratricopeptide (TPR) repeat protein